MVPKANTPLLVSNYFSTVVLLPYNDFYTMIFLHVQMLHIPASVSTSPLSMSIYKYNSKNTENNSNNFKLITTSENILGRTTSMFQMLSGGAIAKQRSHSMDDNLMKVDWQLQLISYKLLQWQGNRVVLC